MLKDFHNFFNKDKQNMSFYLNIDDCKKDNRKICEGDINKLKNQNKNKTSSTFLYETS